MSENRSDYSLPRFDVAAALPAIHQNPLLQAIGESTFNRFLTKPELTRVIGTIGIQTPNAKDDLIVEQNVYDQAYQLQPVIIDSTKTETDVITYKDVQRTAERLGIDFTDPRSWQTTDQFNFCPPINLDKLINFRDYFWVDTNTNPQYICVQNKRITIQAELSQMAANYLGTEDVAKRLALWPTIENQLNLVYSVVPVAEQIEIPNATVVQNDPIHPPFVWRGAASAELFAAYAPVNDWAVNNKWVHRNDLDDNSASVVATLPIIEYPETLVLTNWTYTKHVWQYRASAAFPWTDTEETPTRAELFANNNATTQFGDEWLGFQQHWQYMGALPPVPVTAQARNQTQPIVPTIAAPGQTVFTTSNTILVGKNVLRVYVNGVRQYGTYAENANDPHSITFFVAPPAGARVELHTEVAAASDVGMESASPFQLNLVAYRLEEQQKHYDNDYPMFDLVDVHGNSLHESSSIFSFTEDPSYPVHPILGKRVAYNALDRDYGFDIGLVDSNKKFKFYLDIKGGVRSVWTKDETGAKYVPSRIDAKRVPTSDVTAPWEIPGPFMNNMAHECRHQLRFSELFIHFQSIVNAQSLSPAETAVYGSINTNSYRLNNHINPGAGGTIKEYNGNFANFVSAIISSDYSPLEVISFAQSQYEAKLIEVRQQVEANLIDILLDSSPAVQQDVHAALMTAVLDAMNRDASQGKIYDDSSVSVNTNVKNFVATLPYIGMARPVKPSIIRDDKLGILRLVHHDGHSRVGEMVNASNIARALKASLTPSQTPPAATLGKLWLNATTDVVSRFDGSQWLPLDVLQITLNVLLDVETQLYAGAPAQNPSYNIEALRQTNPTKFDHLMQIEFETYCKTNSIASPYAGDFDITNPFTWNYGEVDVSGDNSSVDNRIPGVNIPWSPTLQGKWANRWETIYQNVYGTIAPHLEPWVLQGYGERPDWWDAAYKGIARPWTTSMWYNINHGIVPPGHLTSTGNIGTGLPNQIAPVLVTSVQTNNRTIGGYAADSLLPPYWPYDTRDDVNNGDYNQAMLVSNFDYQRANVTNNQYLFGANGPKEMAWKQTIGYLYARMKAAFVLDPVNFLNATFGEKMIKVKDLEICERTSNVLSHHDVLFHGDADDNGVKQYFMGINQWYVQLFRYTSLYGTGGSAQRVWANWTTQLAYNVGGFLVDNTLSINSARIDVAPNDYKVQMKTAKKVRDQWIDALYLTVEQAGSYRELPQGAGRDWKFNVGVRSPVIRDIPYYGVKKYRVSIDAATSVFTIDGGVTLTSAGWKLGSSVMLDLGVNGILPSAIDDTTYYSIIPVAGVDNQFRLAIDANDAILGKAIEMRTAGSGTFYVAELLATFYAFEATNTDNLWKHYVVNKNDLRKFSSSVSVTGLQNVVDFVDGYIAYLSEQGYVFNESSVPEYDENDRLITWQYEIEATINYLYLQMGSITTFSANSIAFQVGEVELNPFRNNLWVNHPVGVVSEFNNVLNSNIQAFVYDRDGRKKPVRDYHVIRQDNRTQFSTLSVPDNVLETNMAAASYDPANRMAGIHMFFDEYEHVILFNPKTISGEYMYDQFLGVAIPRMQTYFEKQTTSAKRPNVGGFVLQGNSLTQNFEYTAANIPKYYDTFTVNENANFVGEARSMLGYKPNASYFDGSTVTPKSQFLFYKGMIKAKGTMASVKAFTSSAQAASTEIDEYWAYKAYEFGDKRAKVSYTINLSPQDTSGNLLKFQFVATPLSDAAEDFTKIAVSDSSRWYNFPSQLSYLSTISTLFGMKPMAMYQTSGVAARTVTIDGVTSARTLISHGQATGISVMVQHQQAPTRTDTIASTSSALVNLWNAERPFSYVMGIDGIDVYLNGVKTKAYVETSNTAITMTPAVTGVVVVVKKTGRLVEGADYIRRNSRTIELLKANVNAADVQIIAYKADYSDCGPVKLYDQKAEVVIADIAPWDPINGYDSALLVQNIDHSDKVDPAQYNMNPDVSKINNRDYWAKTAVGSTWKDTASYAYAPYDEVTLPGNKQLADWGSLAEWSDPAVYQWVESTVSPANWDPANGTPRKEVYVRSRIMGTIGYMNVVEGRPGFHMDGGIPFANGDEVVLFGGKLPSGVDEKTIYTVMVYENAAYLLNRDGTALNAIDDGIEFPIRIAKAAYSNTWTKLSQVIADYEMMNVDFNANILNLEGKITAPNEVAIFINGKYLQDGFVEVSGSTQFVTLEPETIAPYRANSNLYQLTVLTKTGLLDGLPSTVPADIDLTDSTSQYYTSYPYSQVLHVNELTEIPQPLYYFWVRGLITGNSKKITMPYAEYLISNNDEPYMVCMHPTVIDGKQYLDRLIISGVNGKVSDTDRYVLRLAKNSTMRDTVFNSKGELLNPVHSQWIMFRENQPNNIERALWDKVIESMVGYSLADPSNSVPALDRVIYDAQHSTSTRFGLNKDQAFVDGQRALDTILAHLNSPTIVYEDMDIDAFMARFNFATKADIVKTMTAIYMTFPAKYINMLFFAVMNDALSDHTVDYSQGLMKTSMISLSGTYALNVNGVQDE